MKKSTFAKLVDREMRKHPHTKKRADFLWNYYKVDLDLLGLSLPVQRGRFKLGYKEIAEFPPEKQAEYWFHVWSKSGLMESLSQAVFFFEKWALDRKKLLKRGDIENVFDPLWPYLTKMIDRCNNWVHSDGLSGLLSAAVEERPARYALLKKWNRDKNPWRRRQSIVALHFYSRFRTKPLPSSKTLPLIRNLLHDDHFYVQRGVGWALRECHNVDPKTAFRFIEKHIADIPPIGYFAAVENFDAGTKARLKAKRLKARAKKSHTAR